jgi:predicted RND superfamily exporter protein
VIRAYLDELEARGLPEKVHVTGRAIVEGLFDIYIPQEGYRILPFVFVMLAAVMFATFRTLRGVVLPFLVIIGTEIWMFGFLGAWGHPMYSITSILPIIIVSIAVADSIHLVATYYEVQDEHPAADRTFVIERVLDEMTLPVFLTSVTEAIGFLTMTGSKLEPINDFGIVGAVGVTAAFILTQLLIPSLLVMLPLRNRPGAKAPRIRFSLDPVLIAPARFCDRHPALVVTGFAIVLATTVGGMLRLTTDSSQVGQFPPNHHLRYADDLDNRHFAGSTILDVLIDGREKDALKSPWMLARLDRFQERLEDTELVRDTFSIAELVKRMNRVMNENRAEEERIPAERDLIAQYLLLYSISGDPGDFDDLVDYDYRYAHVMAFIPVQGTAASRAVVEDAREIIAEVFGPSASASATVKLAGGAYINSHLEDYINHSQLVSLLTGLPTLFVLSWVVFGGPLLGLLCVMPVSLAVALIYGTMGYVGLPTDIATTMLGAMTLGVGIDFAIHYMHRYRACLGEGLDPHSAAIETARTAGRALFYNAAVLIGGFIVLLGARLYPQIKLGLLVSATMVICYVATMLLFPAALGFMARRGWVAPARAHRIAIERQDSDRAASGSADSACSSFLRASSSATRFWPS